MLDGLDPLNLLQMEKRYFHKLGHVVWVLLSVSLVRDDAGGPLYFISQIQDITARKEAEARLVESGLSPSRDCRTCCPASCSRDA